MKRFSIVDNGYDIDEVNKFVDIVIRKLELLNNENITYKKQIEALESRQKDNVNIDEKLSRAILAAEDAADKMKKLAKSESTMMIEDAVVHVRIPSITMLPIRKRSFSGIIPQYFLV